MNDFWTGLGIALVILAVCGGLTMCNMTQYMVYKSCIESHTPTECNGVAP